MPLVRDRGEIGLGCAAALRRRRCRGPGLVARQELQAPRGSGAGRPPPPWAGGRCPVAGATWRSRGHRRWDRGADEALLSRAIARGRRPGRRRSGRQVGSRPVSTRRASRTPTLTRRAGADGAEFVVWAETAVPGLPALRHGPAELDPRLVRESGAWLFTRVSRRRTDSPTAACAVQFLRSVRPRRPDRRPLRQAPPAAHRRGDAVPALAAVPGQLNVGQAEWEPGESAAADGLVATLPTARFPFSGMICFESAFGALARDSVRRGSRCLVIITNDGWFGRTAGPRQHAWLARHARGRDAACRSSAAPTTASASSATTTAAILDWLDLGRRGMVTATILPGRASTLYRQGGRLALAWVPPRGWRWACWVSGPDAPERRQRA